MTSQNDNSNNVDTTQVREAITSAAAHARSLRCTESTAVDAQGRTITTFAEPVSGHVHLERKPVPGGESIMWFGVDGLFHDIEARSGHGLLRATDLDELWSHATAILTGS